MALQVSWIVIFTEAGVGGLVEPEEALKQGRVYAFRFQHPGRWLSRT